jgi:hypothetical protein
LHKTLSNSIVLKKSDWDGMYDKRVEATSDFNKDIKEDVFLRFNTSKKHSMI